MSIHGLKGVPPTDAVGISASLLSTALAAARLPRGATKLATTVAPIVPELHQAAQASHDALLVSLAQRDGRVIGRGAEVRDAKEVEKDLDRLVSGLYQRLASMIKERVAGADALQQYLFPDGQLALTRLSGRPQRARYDQWVLTWSERPAQGSAADVDVSASMGRLEDEIQRFGEVLDGKDHVSRRATDAIDEAGDAFAAWTEAMGELILAMEVVLQKDADAFENWLSPYTEWKRAQSRARRAAGEDTLSEEDGIAPGPTPAPEPPLSSGPQ